MADLLFSLASLLLRFYQFIVIFSLFALCSTLGVPSEFNVLFLAVSCFVCYKICIQVTPYYKASHISTTIPYLIIQLSNQLIIH